MPLRTSFWSSRVSAALAGLAVLVAGSATPAHADGFLYFRDAPAAKAVPSPRSAAARKPRAALEPATGLDVRPAARTAPQPARPRERAKATERVYLFTPSAKAGADGRGVSLGVTSRLLADPVRSTAAGYGVGVSVGYGGFAVEAGYSKVDDLSPLTSGEGVDLGLSYGGRDWRTRLLVSGERFASTRLPPALGKDASYSVELGGAYELTPSLSVTGGVKYAVTVPGQALPSLERDERNSAAFVGAEIKF